MNFDWIIAIGVFLVFVVWSFTFYAGLFNLETDISSALEQISDIIIENVTVKTHSIPVKHIYTESPSGNEVFYFEYRWPFGKNTTNVYFKGSSQNCNVTGNRIYWYSTPVQGDNYFTIKYSDLSIPLECTGGFPVQDIIQVVPLSVEETVSISQTALEGVNSTEYEGYRNSLGIARNFNIILESDTFNMQYGPTPPRNIDIFSKELPGKLDSGDEAKLVILTW